MMLLWIRGVVAHRFSRVAGAAAGIALTVSLLGTLVLFLVDAGASMTARAISSIPIDWQVQVVPGTDPDLVQKALSEVSAIKAVHRVLYADTAGFEARAGGTTQVTGQGQVIALGDTYLADFPGEVRLLSGNPKGVLIAQQTAANLHVGPGDIVTIKRIGFPPADVQIAGVIDLPDADSLFQAVGLRPQAAPQAPPDNILVIATAQWQQLFDPQQKERRDTVRQEFHVRMTHDALPSDPAAASTFIAGAAKNFEAKMPGQVLVANNLEARLSAAREDALYASVLFLFLGVPGIALATVLTFAVTSSGSARRRVEQALLRVRGATMRTILTLSAAEAATAALVGTSLGIAWTLLSSIILPGLSKSSGSYYTLAAVAIAGVVIGFVAFLFPAWRDGNRRTTNAARRTIARNQVPLWQRLWLDLLLLAAGGLFFWLSANSGYQIVLAPEGVAATAVDYKAFIAPALFWLGMILLAIRFSDMVISRNGVLIRTIVTPVSGPLAPIVAAALSRQSRRLTAGIAMTALAISFATSTAIFNATYDAQARVDAELTNGSDVTVFGTADKPAGPYLATLASLPEAAQAEPMQHRFAYVGADLQDLYGIDPARIQRATSFSDAYFSGRGAAATLDWLAATPDGVLVSEETVQDFQLQPGDILNLRLLNARDHQYHPIAFKFIGVAREFPTAPKDSFLVANAAYIARMTGSTISEYVLMRAKSSPGTLAQQARSALQSDPFLKVSDIGQAAHLIGSSLTAINLAGLTAIELTYSVVLAAAAAGLILGLGFIERRKSFAILRAIGAKPKQLAAFLWSEGLLVAGGGIAFGLASGLVMAWMLVRLLTGVFDPPPEGLSIPWAYLGIVVALVAGSAVAAVILTRPATEHDTEYLRDL